MLYPMYHNSHYNTGLLEHAQYQLNVIITPEQNYKKPADTFALEMTFVVSIEHCDFLVCVK